MKFLLTALMAVAASARRLPKDIKMNKGIKVDSKYGNNLMSHARRVEGNQEVDFTWVADYSIKFQGCHHISQWNEEADGEEDVRIQTKRLVRFRLCPTDLCTDESGGGCSSGYGEYIIDMNIFLEAYIGSVMEYYEVVCGNLEEGQCACENANDDEKCQWDCFVENGVEEWCADENPYEYNDEQEELQLEEVMECANWEPNNGRRKLNQEIQYFVGPYCSSQGGTIHLGLFTDESCTLFADDSAGLETYNSLNYNGKPLPYSKESEKSIITLDCISCKELGDGYNNYNDYNDEDEIIEMCEEIYEQAGKCESYGLSNVVRNPNDNACSYMEGIKIVRLDGAVDTKSSSSGGANKTASIFIGIFVVAFVLLAAYVYYLKTKLDRASINLAE